MHPIAAPTISRRQLLAAAATVTVAGFVAAGAASAAAPVGATSFAASAPTRLADTRPDQGVGGFTYVDANTIRVKVAGRAGVLAQATAAVLNLTVTGSTAPGYVTVSPAGTPRPNASSLNVERAGQTIANLVTVRLGTDGAVDIYTQNWAHLVVDVLGAYVPAASAVTAGRFVGIDPAARIFDTRGRGSRTASGQTERVTLPASVPSTAAAVVVNLTVTESTGSGFVTAYAAGTARPSTSTVNCDGPGQTRANQAIVPIGTVGGIRCIDLFSALTAHLIVDIAGFITGSTAASSTDGLFVPSAPTRALDTRSNAQYGRMYPGWVAEFDFAGRPQAAATVVNLTATETRGAGFFTGYPARTALPSTSNLNATGAGQTVANHAILRTSDRGIAVYTQSGAQVIVDVAGYFTGRPVIGTLPAPTNVVPPPPPPPPPSPLPYRLTVPALGIDVTVLDEVGSRVVDAGLVGRWPETGMATRTAPSHMVLFGHRTTHGGLFYWLHLLAPGHTITLTGADGQVFTYVYHHRNLTGTNSTTIFNAGATAPGPSVSLVACSKTNWLPTDTAHRIVVTFTLVAEPPA
ncbi:unnamed protein product [Phaeothamnion confervicola]